MEKKEQKVFLFNVDGKRRSWSLLTLFVNTVDIVDKVDYVDNADNADYVQHSMLTMLTLTTESFLARCH